MTSDELRATLKESVPVVLGVVVTLSGFALLRVSAVLENWFLLFVAFALMVWGIVLLFTGRWSFRSEGWSSER